MSLSSPRHLPSGILALLGLASCGLPSELPTAPSTDQVEPAGWLEGVQLRIQAQARAIYTQDGAFQIDLPGAGLTGSFGAEGFQARPWDAAQEQQPALGLRFSAWGRPQAMSEVTPVQPRLGACTTDLDPMGGCIRQLEYEHEGLTEWWVGLDNAVEQGWTLPEAPAGSGPLRFEVEISAALGLQDQDGELMITDAGGRAWGVDGIVAWDAHGDPLSASARFQDDLLVVEVDDQGAVYPVTVDPVYSTAAWTLAGGTGYFGTSVAGAGDVDGDGYDDVIVGAYGLGSSVGRAYIYAGGPDGLSTTARSMLDGAATGSRFGFSVAGAGDVDGDGYDDVIVGAWYYSSETGQAFVYHGGPDGVENSAATIITGPASTSYLGYSVAGAGDVDGDGYDDVIIGAPQASSRVGRVYLHHGSAAGVSESADTTLSGPSSNSNFGASVAGAGDVNGDGYDDVIVGANAVSSSTGQATIYHGSARGVSTTAATTLSGPSSSASFGVSVASAGDVDGDGYDDVIVGASGVSSSTGRAYVHHGGSSGVSTTVTSTLVGFSSSNYFGFSVTSLGDVSGDGYDDVAVGSYGYSSSTGRVSIFHGSASGVNSVAAATLAGTSSSAFGYSVAGAGDVDGDGSPDLVVGANNLSSGYGGAYVFYGTGAGMATSAGTTLSPPGFFSSSPQISPVGDLDGDGYDDFAVGSSGYSSNAGIVYVFYGGPAGPAYEADATLVGASSEYLGQVIAPAGDVDGDGYDDLLVSGYSYSSSRGRVHLFRGSASGVEGSALSTITGTTTNGYLGFGLAGAGDTDGDGYGDVVIGAYGISGGRVYLYRGGASGLESSPTTTWSATSSSWQLGRALALGDVNGDGHLDLAIGAPGYTSNQGLVQVYLGSASGIEGSATGSLSGEASSNYFGYQLGFADLDGDGWDDLVVGAYGYDANKGRVYAYHGGASGLSTLPASYLTGSSGTNFGQELFTGGDVNGDGYDDLVVGYSAGNTAWIYEGSADGLSDEPVNTLSGGSGTSFGQQVAMAGDVDGDGFDEVLVAGSAFVWMYNGYVEVDSDGDGWFDSVDCAPLDPDIHPGAVEVCDGVDNDCDDEVDEDLYRTLHLDRDGDGFGHPAESIESCEDEVDGYVSTGTDCDDYDADVHPGAPEICNGYDDDCDSDVDEAFSLGESTWYEDADGDGYGRAGRSTSACDAPDGYVADATDCDDTRSSVYPGAPETCNEIDDDCDGEVDEGLGSTFYRDQDEDGFGDLSSTTVACDAPDGYVADSTDCDDLQGSVYPGAPETCNGADDDCDGEVDEYGAVDAPTWYRDQDGDSYGDPGVPSESCEAPTGFVADSTDCDDTLASAYPGAQELCNGVDDDCDGEVDEDGSLDEATWFEDADGDGFGNPFITEESCDQPEGHVDNSLDCDDTDASINPSAAEIWYDGVDQDCDERDDDQDGDGVGVAEDCDDMDPSVIECPEEDGGGSDGGGSDGGGSDGGDATEPEDKDEGCGCASSGAASGRAGVMVGVLALLGLVRRRSVRRG